MSQHSNTSKVPSKSARNKMIQFQLCVVRHGETPENKNHIYQGHLDSILSEEGIRQTELAGERLKDEKFTHAFASDLKRAYTTAGNILERNRYKEGLALVKDPRIREKAFGVWEGKTKQYVNEEMRKHNSTTSEYVPEGGESWPQMTERLVDFFNDLCKKIHTEITSDKAQKSSVNNEANSVLGSAKTDSSSTNVLMVSHGGAIRQLFYHFIRNISSEFQSVNKKDVGKLCPNTGVSNFDIFVGRESGRAEFVKCTMLYDGSHLIVEDEKILYEDRAL